MRVQLDLPRAISSGGRFFNPGNVRESQSPQFDKQFDLKEDRCKQIIPPNTAVVGSMSPSSSTMMSTTSPRLPSTMQVITNAHPMGLVNSIGLRARTLRAVAHDQFEVDVGTVTRRVHTNILLFERTSQ